MKTPHVHTSSLRWPIALSTIAFLCLSIGGLPHSAGAKTQPAVRQLLTLDQVRSGDQPILRIVSSAPLEWRMSFAADGSPILRIPDSSPGPRFRSRRFEQGPIAAIGISLDGRGSVQETVLTIRTRKPLEAFISQSGETLTMELLPQEPVAPASPGSATRPAAVSDQESRKLRAELERVKAELEEKDRLLTLRSEQSRSRADLEKLAGEAKSGRDAALFRVRTLGQENTGLRRQVQDLEGVVRALETDREAIQTAQNEARTALAESQRFLKIRVQQSEAVRSELERRLTEAEAARDAATAAQSQLSADASVLKLRQSLETTRRELQAAIAERNELEIRLEGTQAALNTATAARQAAFQRLEELEKNRTAPQPRASTLIVGAGAAPCLNIRSSAAASAPILSCVAPGTRLKLLRLESGWVRARLEDGREGWAARDYLEAAGAPSQSPGRVDSLEQR